jgi:hypothetical protein
MQLGLNLPAKFFSWKLLSRRHLALLVLPAILMPSLLSGASLAAEKPGGRPRSSPNG